MSNRTPPPRGARQTARTAQRAAPVTRSHGPAPRSKPGSRTAGATRENRSPTTRSFNEDLPQRQQRTGARRIVAPPRRKTPHPLWFTVGRSENRLRWLLAALVILLVFVLLRVGGLQTGGGEARRIEGARQWHRNVTLNADRGTIFDRNGDELAMSVPSSTISVNPKLVTDALGTAQILGQILGLDTAEATDLYNDLVAKKTGFRYVQRHVDQAVGEQIASLQLTGVNVDSEDKRVLPGGSTGRSVIGLTDIDGVGIAGLEKQYNDLLTGSPGKLTKEVAHNGRSIAGTEFVEVVPVPGDDLVLTIDRSIQFAAEQALIDRVTELGARSGTVVVMDSATGDIYASASVRRGDDDIVAITSGNFAVVDAYEPGSVAKVITIAAGLNERAVTAETEFLVPWHRKYADDDLKDSHQHADELMTVERIFVESSNIGTIDVQQATGREKHWNYMRLFGLGETSSLRFPGESPGILKHWSDLWGSERVTVAYGQGVASTSVQLASAINVIANDGMYVSPRLVKATVRQDGRVVDAAPSVTHQVVRPEVAAIMRYLMRRVVCDPKGTGELAQQGIGGFSVAGKTGTGFKAQPNGTYYNDAGEHVYYASYVGFFPAEAPRVTVLVSIDEPPAGDINRFGGTAAAPVFARLAPTIVHELGIIPPANSTPC